MDFTSIIKTVAPWIGTALGGPLGGMAVEAAANALGLSDKTVDAVKQAIGGATPEQMLALKQADQAFALQMQALDFKQISDLEALAAGDRASARSMQTAKPSPVPALLSIGVTTGYFGILIGVMLGWLRIDDSQVCYGVGVDANIVSASLRAIISGVQRVPVAAEEAVAA